MAGQLWISPDGKKRRRGTTFTEIQSLFINQITTRHIYEPLECTPLNVDTEELLNDLNALDFDVVGVIDHNENIIGFIRREKLSTGSVSEFELFNLNIVLTDSTPLHKLIQLLSKNSFLFVMHGNAVNGIITIADINKPIVRLYLFSAISLLEMHMNFWINEFYKSESWKSILKHDQLDEATQQFDSRRHNNSTLSLLMCLQFSAKREILCSSKEFLKDFNFSVIGFNRLFKRAEKIRNQLAHSQESIIKEIGMEKFATTVYGVEIFLEQSEKKIEQTLD